MDIVAGVDETGRGSACFELLAASCILDPNKPIQGLTDSKKLSAKRREQLAEEIKDKSIAFCIAEASVIEIENLNVLHATMLAMQRSVEGLNVIPNLVLVDGNRLPELSIPAEAIIKGDLKIPAISAASILAKVERDRRLKLYDAKYPEYGFAAHKGYLTKKHMDALKKYGPCPQHRKSYKPIRQLLEEKNIG
ncbi:ribonuclease HII [Neptuniibacter marinus]|uniref:ribonuclease HII n=1 Tax=Neptuniibacter marinus TaxID=1806670 RepID=UPI000831BB9D|nr:ribonuclease HII [Neptuniibacter marinus]